jgi:hypothetical protein
MFFVFFAATASAPVPQEQGTATAVVSGLSELAALTLATSNRLAFVLPLAHC